MSGSIIDLLDVRLGQDLCAGRVPDLDLGCELVGRGRELVFPDVQVAAVDLVLVGAGRADRAVGEKGGGGLRGGRGGAGCAGGGGG